MCPPQEVPFVWIAGLHWRRLGMRILVIPLSVQLQEAISLLLKGLHNSSRFTPLHKSSDILVIIYKSNMQLHALMMCCVIIILPMSLIDLYLHIQVGTHSATNSSTRVSARTFSSTPESTSILTITFTLPHLVLHPIACTS